MGICDTKYDEIRRKFNQLIYTANQDTLGEIKDKTSEFDFSEIDDLEDDVDSEIDYSTVSDLMECFGISVNSENSSIIEDAMKDEIFNSSSVSSACKEFMKLVDKLKNNLPKSSILGLSDLVNSYENCCEVLTDPSSSDVDNLIYEIGMTPDGVPDYSSLGVPYDYIDKTDSVSEKIKSKAKSMTNDLAFG